MLCLSCRSPLRGYLWGWAKWSCKIFLLSCAKLLKSQKEKLWQAVKVLLCEMANSFHSCIGCPLRQSSESRKCVTLEHNLTAYAEWMTSLRMELDGDTELDLVRDQGKVELVRRDNPLYWMLHNFLLQKQLPPGRDWADQKFCGLGISINGPRLALYQQDVRIFQVITH